MMIKEFVLDVKTGAGGLWTSAQNLGNVAVAALAGRDCLLCLAPSGAAMLCVHCERLLQDEGPRCAGCGCPVPSPFRCGGCLRRPPAHDRLRTAFDYRFPLDRLIHRFKYGSDLVVGAWLAARLSMAGDTGEGLDLVMPVPTTASRLRARGFHPAGWLARRVAADRGLPFDDSALRRVLDTPPQSGLGRSRRLRVLRRAFLADRGLAGHAIALVDDVTTTGATLEAATRALRRAGATRVEAWVVARTPSKEREAAPWSR